MICRACRKDLNFPKAVLKQLSTCPYCEAPVKMEPDSLEEAFLWFLEDNGVDILRDENAAHLDKLLKVAATSKFPDANKIELLRVFGILQRVYDVREASAEEKTAVLDACLKSMTDLHVEPLFAKSALDLLLHGMKLDVGFDWNVFVDPRDGNKYKIVKIGNKVWLAENLRYRSNDSFVYKDNHDCEQKYGRLYNIFKAADACPRGWHLPTIDEWKSLTAAAGNTASALQTRVGEWSNATDEIGFSAVPAGVRFGGEYFCGNKKALFCLETISSTVHYAGYLEKNRLGVEESSKLVCNIAKSGGDVAGSFVAALARGLGVTCDICCSIRCVKDD